MDKPELKELVINTDWCKGCGICAEECPTNAIEMIEETGQDKQETKGDTKIMNIIESGNVAAAIGVRFHWPVFFPEWVRAVRQGFHVLK